MTRIQAPSDTERTEEDQYIITAACDSFRAVETEQNGCETLVERMSRNYGPLMFCCAMVLGNFAVVLSLVGAFICKFASVHESTSSNDVLIGLWYRESLFLVENQAGDYVVDRSCGKYDDESIFDGAWKAAKAFSVMAPIFGTLSLISVASMFSHCIPLSETAWKLSALSLLLASCFQGLSFLFLRSNACGTDRTFYSDEFGTIEFEAGCQLAWGANVVIAASVMWFVTGAIVCITKCPSSDDDENETEPKETAVDDTEEAETASPGNDNVIDKPVTATGHDGPTASNSESP